MSVRNISNIKRIQCYNRFICHSVEHVTLVNKGIILYCSDLFFMLYSRQYSLVFASSKITDNSLSR